MTVVTANRQATRTVNLPAFTNQKHDFGVCDRLNRKMGISITLETMTIEREMTAEEREYGSEARKALFASGRREAGFPVGVYYSYDSRATRNGNGHQASHHGKVFTTEAERDAAVAKLIKSTKARALKPEARTRA